MNTPALASTGSGVINLDQPGTYLHWSIFTVSVANLVLIAVMVVIFGLALVLPFPTGRTYPAAEDLPAGTDPGTLAGAPGPARADLGEDEDAGMWTYRLRRLALRRLPPGKLLPDRQPAYVASWVYVFGVASLAALGVAIVSGFALALGGPDWWHTNPIGHFFNSLHLWSVEFFMALLVIHLWGKFWMAAWRGRRTMTWITGVTAFVASDRRILHRIPVAAELRLPVDLHQREGRLQLGRGRLHLDAMNLGQMLLWHVVLVPIVLVASSASTSCWCGSVASPTRCPSRFPQRPRRRAGAPEGPAGRRRRAMARPDPPLRHHQGGQYRRADGPGVTFRLAGCSPLPDVPSTPSRVVQGGPGRLPRHRGDRAHGTSETASYGPPYNNANGSVQSLGVSPQNVGGVTQPIKLRNLRAGATGSWHTPTQLAAALTTYKSASPAHR